MCQGLRMNVCNFIQQMLSLLTPCGIENCKLALYTNKNFKAIKLHCGRNFVHLRRNFSITVSRYVRNNVVKIVKILANMFHV